MSTISVDSIKDRNGGNTAQINTYTPTESNMAGRNRIINGGMDIDQRNAGASVTPAQDNFMTDRWKWGQSQSSKFTAQQSTTAPSGFTNSLLMTVTSAVTVGSSDYFSVYQPIEGLNVSDLGWGTANAQPVTLSFKVRSSLTGTFGGAIRNSAGNRSYPFTYTISSANTFEDKTVTIAGDTSGTWLTTNGVGMYVQFSLGVGTTLSGTAGSWAGANYLSATGATSVVGTNGATFYITGVQLEVGSVATPFERRPYGTELALCQRYYYKVKATGGDGHFGNSYNANTTSATGLTLFPVTMRTKPTALEQSGTAGDYRIRHGVTSTTCSTVPVFDAAEDFAAVTQFTVASGLTAGQGSILRSVNSSAYLAWSAEL